MLFGNANFHVEQDQLGLQMNPIHTTTSSTRSSFELEDSSSKNTLIGKLPEATTTRNLNYQLRSSISPSITILRNRKRKRRWCKLMEVGIYTNVFLEQENGKKEKRNDYI
ncbi:hypothetical protein MIMGU_mgv11b014004mg [Erythranthe guttata]|uniref:Uncharacterized protein n=1 Tax=Erythranthe guttata TaxID=4155 RepID=A0A022RED7_ERYGU|nr:hypothetical protein MIMGU_mgv11b014004mg [Erythranthe guttata]